MAFVRVVLFPKLRDIFAGASVSEVFAAQRAFFGKNRKSGARKMRGGQWNSLYSLSARFAQSSRGRPGRVVRIITPGSGVPSSQENVGGHQPPAELGRRLT